MEKNLYVTTPEGVVIEDVHGLDVHKCLLYLYVRLLDGSIATTGDKNVLITVVHRDFDIVDRTGLIISEARIKS